MARRRRRFRTRRRGLGLRRYARRYSRATGVNARQLSRDLTRLARVGRRTGVSKTRRVRAHVGPEWLSRANATSGGTQTLYNPGSVAQNPQLPSRNYVMYGTATPNLANGANLGQMVGRRLSSCRWQIRFTLGTVMLYGDSGDTANTYSLITPTWSCAVRMVVYQVKNGNGVATTTNQSYHEFAFEERGLIDVSGPRVVDALFRYDDDIQQFLSVDASVTSLPILRFRSGIRDDIQILYDKTRVLSSGNRQSWIGRMKFKINPLSKETRNNPDILVTESMFDNHVFAVWIIQPIIWPGAVVAGETAYGSTVFRTQMVIQDTLLYKDN